MKLEDQLRRAIQRGMIQFDSPLAPRDMLTKKPSFDGDKNDQNGQIPPSLSQKPISEVL